MRLPQPSGGMGRTKNIIHFVQAFIIFIAWAMTIAIWTKGGSGIDGRTAWYWALVSFTSLSSLLAEQTDGIREGGKECWF